MPIYESYGINRRERWPAQWDIEGISRDEATRATLKAQIQEGNSMALSGEFQGEKVIPRDLSKPVFVPYVHREFPKLMYHPTYKTEASALAKQKAETYNHLHPEKPELVPELLPVTHVVNNREEQAKAEMRGFTDKAPNPSWYVEQLKEPQNFSNAAPEIEVRWPETPQPQVANRKKVRK